MYFIKYPPHKKLYQIQITYFSEIHILCNVPSTWWAIYKKKISFNLSFTLPSLTNFSLGPMIPNLMKIYLVVQWADSQSSRHDLHTTYLLYTLHDEQKLNVENVNR